MRSIFSSKNVTHQSFDIEAGIRIGYLRHPNVQVSLEKNNLGKIQVSDKLINHTRDWSPKFETHKCPF